MTSSEWLPQQAAFEFVRRGYSPEQVNEYLDRLEYEMRILTADRDSANHRLSELTAQLQASTSEAEEFRRQLDRTALEPTSMAGLSERMQRMIRLAEDESTEIRTRARAEASEQHAAIERRVAELDSDRRAFDQEREQVRAQLAQQVQDLLGEAHSESDRVRSDAAGQAAAMLGSAQQEATRLVTEARQQAEQLTTETRTQADQLSTETRTKAELLTAETQERTDQLIADTIARADEVTTQARQEADRLVAEATDFRETTLARVQEQDAAATAERARLDAEADHRRTEVEEDFTIAIAARRTQAHQYIQQQEHESREQADELVSNAREQARQMLAAATVEANRRVSYAAQESHRRVGEAEDAVDALLQVRLEVLGQLAGLQPYLGQVQQAMYTAGELLAETAGEPQRPGRADFDPLTEELQFAPAEGIETPARPELESDDESDQEPGAAPRANGYAQSTAR